MAKTNGDSGKSRPLVYTDGDQAMLEHLHHVRWSLAEDLAVAVDRPLAKVRQRLSRLRSNRLVDFDRPTLGAGAWRVTALGHEMAGLEPRVAKPIRAYGWAHTLTISALSAALVAEGVDHLTDPTLKAEVGRCRQEKRSADHVAVRNQGIWQVPDLLIALPGGDRLAIEVELSGKARHRIRSLLAGYRASGWQVIYLADPSVSRLLERELGKISAGRLGDEQIRVWPAPVLKATATKPDRPYTEAAREVAREIRDLVENYQPQVVTRPSPTRRRGGRPMAPPPGAYR